MNTEKAKFSAATPRHGHETYCPSAAGQSLSILSDLLRVFSEKRKECPTVPLTILKTDMVVPGSGAHRIIHNYPRYPQQEYLAGVQNEKFKNKKR